MIYISHASPYLFLIFVPHRNPHVLNAIAQLTGTALTVGPGEIPHGNKLSMHSNANQRIISSLFNSDAQHVVKQSSPTERLHAKLSALQAFWTFPDDF